MVFRASYLFVMGTELQLDCFKKTLLQEPMLLIQLTGFGRLSGFKSFELRGSGGASGCHTCNLCG